MELMRECVAQLRTRSHARKPARRAGFISLIALRGLRPRPAGASPGTGPHPHRASGTRTPPRRAGFISLIALRGLRPQPRRGKPGTGPTPIVPPAREHLLEEL